jgi:hypothetical protein
MILNSHYLLFIYSKDAALARITNKLTIVLFLSTIF